MKKPATSDSFKGPLAGFFGANELVDSARPHWPDFDLIHLWSLVAVELLPTPVFDLPIKPRNSGAFAAHASRQLMMLLSNLDMSISALRELRPEFAFRDADPVVMSTGLLIDADFKVEWEADGEEENKAIKGIKGAVDIAIYQTNAPGRALAVFVSSHYDPRDSAGRLARHLCINDARFGWGAERGELEMVRQGLEFLPSVREMTLRELLGVLSDTAEATATLREQCAIWMQRTHFAKVLGAAVAHKMTKHRGFLEFAAPKTIWHWVFHTFPFLFPLLLGVYLFAGPDLDVGGSALMATFFVVYVSYQFSKLVQYAQREPTRFLSLPTLAALWFALVAGFAIIYRDLMHHGDLNVRDGSPLDMLYFSFVTMTTLGYGDILPTSATARIVASFQACIGTAYIATVVAIVISRLLARRS